MLLRIEIVS